MPSNVSPKPRTYTDNDLVVINGLQYKPEDVPDGVDIKKLKTLREHLDENRVGGKQAVKPANKSAS